jgi:hypothetical protein
VPLGDVAVSAAPKFVVDLDATFHQSAVNAAILLAELSRDDALPE